MPQQRQNYDFDRPLTDAIIVKRVRAAQEATARGEVALLVASETGVQTT